VRAARQYVQLLRDHIDKEHGIVFPLADAVLDEQMQGRIAREFGTVEAEQGTGACIQDAEAVIDHLGAMSGAREPSSSR
jgi:hemerythrin-like domain-containing protein